MPTASQILNILPTNEEMIRKVHQRQQERIQRRLWLEKKQVSRWNKSGFHATVMPDGTHVQYRVPRASYMYWAKRLGDECWQDAGFIREFLRDNPECRVNNKSTKICSGWTPASSYARKYNRMRVEGKQHGFAAEAASAKFDKYAIHPGGAQ